MTAGHAWDELYERVEHLPPAKMRRILRLVIDELDASESESDEDRPPAAARPALTWDELRASAESLPTVDSARFRDDIDAIADHSVDLGGMA